jgi:hypothetical protein
VNKIRDVLTQAAKMGTQLKDLHARTGQGALADELSLFEQKLDALMGGGGGRRFRRGPAGTTEPTFNRVSEELQGLMDLFQGADALPTNQGVAALDAAEKNMKDLFNRWDAMQKRDLKILNEHLRAANLPELKAE